MLRCQKGKGIYRDTLNHKARDRYMEKVNAINGLDLALDQNVLKMNPVFGLGVPSLDRFTSP